MLSLWMLDDALALDAQTAPHGSSDPSSTDGFRRVLPKGSRASDMSALKFNQTVETIYGKVRGVSRSSNNWQTHMIALDHLLKPQEKPIWTSTTRPRASPLCRSPARDRRRAAEGRQDGLLADTLSGSCRRWDRARS